jgi:hypothetical protein
MAKKLKVSDFNKRVSQAKTFREWREEECLSAVGMTESVYSTSSRRGKKTILDEALEEEFNVSRI